MKKLLLGLLILGSFNVMATGSTSSKSGEEKIEVKKFKNLKAAAEDYAKVLQEISNYGSRQLLQTINPEVDRYVETKKNVELSKKWDETNMMLIEQFEVSVQKVNENKDKGDVLFLIKGYDEQALDRYLNDNADKYAKVTALEDVEIDIEKYIDLQYQYLKNTPKINLATSRVDFVKDSDGWKVVEENQKK